jgi:type II secretory pathway pseudopilin PulG
MIIKKRGLYLAFSLIELLLVVSIIALLVIASIWAYRRQLWKGWDAKRKSDIYKINSVLEEYEKDNDCYPLSLPLCGSDGEDNFLRSYLSIIPCDPQTKLNYYYYPQGNTSCPKWYWIFSSFSNESDLIIAEQGCSLGCGPTVETASFDYYQASPNAPEPVKNQSSSLPTSGTIPSGGFGCFDGICQPIKWDYSIPGPECIPNYTTPDCGELCRWPSGEPRNNCE